MADIIKFPQKTRLRISHSFHSVSKPMTKNLEQSTPWKLSNQESEKQFWEIPVPEMRRSSSQLFDRTLRAQQNSTSNRLQRFFRPMIAVAASLLVLFIGIDSLNEIGIGQDPTSQGTVMNRDNSFVTAIGLSNPNETPVSWLEELTNYQMDSITISVSNASYNLMDEE